MGPDPERRREVTSTSQSSSSSVRTGSRIVCHLIASNFLGGPEKQIVEHCCRLDPRRWRGIVGSFRENRDRVEVVDEARKKNITAFLIDTKWQFNPSGVRDLRRLLQHHGVDLLITHGYKSNLIGYLARARLSIPQVPYVRGYTGENWRIQRYEEIDRKLLRRFKRILSVSEGTRQRLGSYGIRMERISVVHNAVDCSGEVATVDLRKDFAIPEEAAILVAAGRLSPEKGHRFLFEAMSSLSDLAFPLHLVLLGSGREDSSLRRQALSLGLSNNVHFAGFRHPVLPYLAAADLVVNPSLSEGFPNVLLEALSVGTPVVATRVGGVGELIEEGKTGWLIPPARPSELAAAIREALGSPADAKLTAERGQRLVSDFFTFELQAQKLMAIYDRAVSSGSAMDS